MTTLPGESGTPLAILSSVPSLFTAHLSFSSLLLMAAAGSQL